MKKLLIATTALVGTASVAVADVTFSGYGRFGALYEDDRQCTGDDATGDDCEEIRLESRYRLNIDGVTETDGGVRFAARIRVEANDNEDRTANAGSFSGARFQVSVGGFRVRVGNISGVFDAAETINYFGFEPGLIGQIGQYSTFGGGPLDAFQSTSAGVNGVNVKYEAGDFAIMGSYSDDTDENDGYKGTGDDYESWEVGASYTFSGWTIAGAYGSTDYNSNNEDTDLNGVDNDYWAVTLTGSFAAADLVLFVGDSDADGEKTAYGISGSYPIGASTSILASYAGGGNNDLYDTYGVGVDHSLGGGVNLRGMVGRQNNKNTIADFGVIFNF